MGKFREESARVLIDRASEAPQQALDEAITLLTEVDTSDHAIRAILLRAMALAARRVTGTEASVDYAEQSLKEADLAGSDDLKVDALLTLGGSLALRGDNEKALDVLGSAMETAKEQKAAQVRFQLGSVRARMGDSAEARELFTDALPAFRQHDDGWFLAMTLHNRGMLNLYSGDLEQALSDFEEARELEARLGLEAPLAAVEHNIGVAVALTGDLPRALQLLDASESRYAEIAGSPSEVQVSKVEVLMSAGLFEEARALAATIGAELKSRGLHEDSAEAVLSEAVAAHLANDSRTASRKARDAAAMFEEQARPTWEANATQVELAARLEEGTVESADIDTARSLSDRLDADGQSDAAFQARLTAGLIARHLGRDREAIADLRAISGISEGTVQRRLESALALATVNELEGRPQEALVAAKQGMGLLDDYQAALGATDVRVGVERHAGRIGDLGLRLATATGDPDLIFEWIERRQARSLLHKPVKPPDDEEQASDLTALRQLESSMRTADPGALDELRSRESELQEAIRGRSRRASGPGGSRSGASTADVVSELGETSLVEFGEVDGIVWAVVISSGEVSAQPVASIADLYPELESLRFNLRLLARGRGDLSRVTDSAELVDTLLFGNLPLGDDALLLVPTPRMYSVPWSVLPTASRGPVVVCPSAEVWTQLKRADRAVISGIPAVVAGPDLAHADFETAEITRLYQSANLFDSSNAKVDSVLAAVQFAPVAHFASHAFFQYENPMFSSLRLSDGDLHVYDIERLETAPPLVVLSGCDSGFSESRTGEELLGLSTALLSMGTRSVVASVGLVPDTDATTRLMIELHDRLKEKVSPAVALHRARAAVSDSTEGFMAAANFVCIGAD